MKSCTASNRGVLSNEWFHAANNLWQLPPFWRNSSVKTSHCRPVAIIYRSEFTKTELTASRSTNCSSASEMNRICGEMLWFLKLVWMTNQLENSQEPKSHDEFYTFWRYYSCVHHFPSLSYCNDAVITFHNSPSRSADQSVVRLHEKGGADQKLPHRL